MTVSNFGVTITTRVNILFAQSQTHHNARTWLVDTLVHLGRDRAQATHLVSLTQTPATVHIPRKADLKRTEKLKFVKSYGGYVDLLNTILLIQAHIDTYPDINHILPLNGKGENWAERVLHTLTFPNYNSAAHVKFDNLHRDMIDFYMQFLTYEGEELGTDVYIPLSTFIVLVDEVINVDTINTKDIVVKGEQTIEELARKSAQRRLSWYHRSWYHVEDWTKAHGKTVGPYLAIAAVGTAIFFTRRK